MKKFIFLILTVLSSCISKNTPPDCEIIMPEPGSIYYQGESIDVYIDAEDEDGDVEEVRVYLDGLGITSMSSFPYRFLLETSQLELGSHSIKVEAYDNYREKAVANTTFNLRAPAVE